MIDNLSSIRCPSIRNHNKYQLCGRLLGAVKDGEIYLYCETCKTFYKISVDDNDNIEMIPLAKNKRLSFKTSLRLVH